MSLYKMCKTEVKRICSVTNLMSTFCFSILVLLMCLLTYAKENGFFDNYFYYLFKEIYNGGYFSELLFIPIGYYVTVNVCMDITEKIYCYYIARTNINSYILSKFIVGVIYSFVMVMIVMNICILLGMNILPVVDNSYYSDGVDIYEDILKTNVLFYFELRILFISMVTSLFVAIGMVLSAVINNVYVAAVSPFLAYILITKLQLILRMPECVQFSGIISGFVRTSSSLGWAFSYHVLFYISCLLLVGIIYYCVMKKRCYHENN